MLMYLRDNDYPQPSGAILMSPWVDLTLSCESWESNAMCDVVPLPLMDSHMNPIVLYLGEQMEKYLTHPYASPLFGSFEGLPPLLLQAGDAEVLRDEISLLAHKASLAGVFVRHEEYDDAVSHIICSVSNLPFFFTVMSLDTCVPVLAVAFCYSSSFRICGQLCAQCLAEIPGRVATSHWRYCREGYGG